MIDFFREPIRKSKELLNQIVFSRQRFNKIKHTPSPDFLKWIESNDPDDIKDILKTSFGKYDDDLQIQKCSRDARKALENDFTINHTLIVKEYSIKEKTYLEFDEKPSDKTHIATLKMYMQPGQIKKITNINIRRLNITSWDLNVDEFLEIENCWIDTVFIDVDLKSNLKFVNCHIGYLIFNREGIRNLHIESTKILSLSCPPPDAKNPFFGQIVIDKDNYFPKEENEYKKKVYNYQQYSNARHHLMNMHNMEAAYVFHKVELRLERPHLSPDKKFVSDLYGFLSDYGYSIKRPIILGAISCIIIFIIFSFPETLEIHNRFDLAWLHDLKCEGTSRKGGKLFISNEMCFLPAFGLSAQTFFVPSGIFLGSENLIPSTPLLNFIYLLHRFLMSALGFLLLLAIRRKFRITV